MRTAQLTVIFTVTGTGRFPADMLRYDRCYPVDGESATNIGMPTEDVRAARTRRSVKLETVKPGGPTPGRWESFGWRVMDEQYE
jgi:hypothetical protein